MKEYLKQKIADYEKEVAYYEEQITKAGAKIDLLNELIEEENMRNFTECAADGADTQESAETNAVSSVY